MNLKFFRQTRICVSEISEFPTSPKANGSATLATTTATRVLMLKFLHRLLPAWLPFEFHNTGEPSLSISLYCSAATSGAASLLSGADWIWTSPTRARFPTCWFRQWPGSASRVRPDDECWTLNVKFRTLNVIYFWITVIPGVGGLVSRWYLVTNSTATGLIRLCFRSTFCFEIPSWCIPKLCVHGFCSV